MDGGFRDWWAGLSRREIALVAALGLAAVGGGVAWYARSAPAPIPVEEASEPVVAPSPTEGTLFVHVAGRVRKPGVYELPPGSRVIDAIDLAGGPRRNALLDAVNLAAVLEDGQQVLIPKEPPEGGAREPQVPPGTAGEVTAKVNINTADAAALETLPGIGEVKAGSIIEYREQNGPFTSVDDLINVSGIGEVTLEQLRPLVSV